MLGRPLICAAAFLAAAPASGTAQASTADLEAIVARVLAREHVVGASVLVAQGERILLHQGYGFADLGPFVG